MNKTNTGAEFSAPVLVFSLSKKSSQDFFDKLNKNDTPTGVSFLFLSTL